MPVEPAKHFRPKNGATKPVPLGPDMPTLQPKRSLALVSWAADGQFTQPIQACETKHTLWLFNIAMENGPFIDDFPIKTSIYKGFSMAMLNNQMVFVFCFRTTKPGTSASETIEVVSWDVFSHQLLAIPGVRPPKPWPPTWKALT